VAKWREGRTLRANVFLGTGATRVVVASRCRASDKNRWFAVMPGCRIAIMAGLVAAVLQEDASPLPVVDQCAGLIGWHRCYTAAPFKSGSELQRFHPRSFTGMSTANSSISLSTAEGESSSK
jgi:hypothetical protein